MQQSRYRLGTQQTVGKMKPQEQKEKERYYKLFNITSIRHTIMTTMHPIKSQRNALVVYTGCPCSKAPTVLRVPQHAITSTTLRCLGQGWPSVETNMFTLIANLSNVRSDPTFQLCLLSFRHHIIATSNQPTHKLHDNIFHQSLTPHL